MNSALLDHFRCPESAVRFSLSGELSDTVGFFRFGEDVLCCGRSLAGLADADFHKAKDCLRFVRVNCGEVVLPFDPGQIPDNLRMEGYVGQFAAGDRISAHRWIRNLYYLGRPILPVRLRSVLQRIWLKDGREKPFPSWPVDRTVDRLFEKLMELALHANGNEPIPFIWFWPEGKQASFILTHDVESSAGVAFCPRLMDLDSEFGFRASFQVVPEKRYEVTDSFLRDIKNRGFEVNVHDLNHDGNLFRDHEEFKRRAAKINQYAIQFGTQGFRSGALYRRLDWYDALDISYDMSVPNVAHLDPQSGGCCTIKPYFVGNILELPVTATQDYSLFHILKQYSIDLWKQQTEIIVKGNGMISLITHPDYLIEQKARSTYRQLLAYLADTCRAENIWATLPAEIDRWWRLRRNMRLARAGNSWQIQGTGCERARIAYASLADGKLKYTVLPGSEERQRAYVIAENALAYSDVLSSKENFPVAFSGQRSSTATSLETAVKTVATASQTASGPSDSSDTSCESVKIDMPTVESQRVKSTSDVVVNAKRSHKRLRVCMVAYTFYEADNRVMRYAETLAQEGHDVEVFALKQGDNPTEEVICGVKVHRLQSRLINEKSQFSYAWRIWLFLLRALYHVSKNDLQRKYDLVHVHSVPDFLVFTALLPRLRGTPVILDIHDILPEFYAGKFGGGNASWMFRLLTLVEKTCAGFASHVIIANHIWRERITNRSVSASKCTVVLNSPDRSIFHSSEAALPKNERFVLLYPGTLNWHQGLDIAVRAFAKISAEVPYADFHIYGEGPYKPLLAELIEQLGLTGRVQLHDPRRIREIAGVMEKAHLGIVPKRKDNFGNEAFSTKILEFMAMGVPVIVSDTRIDRYYFNDSLVRFFKGGDEDDLARCMLDLIQHPEKRRALVENATDYINKNDWSVKKQEYLSLVDQLTGAGKPAQTAAPSGN